MSKAFTKESDDDENWEDDESEDDSPQDAVGASGKNYITTQGFQILKNELHELLTVDRPKVVETVAWAASNGDRSENADYIYGKRRLREIDRRIRFLNKRIEAAEVIEPTQLDADRVLFGATVTILNEDDEQRIYKIVGVDESDAKRGHISWMSPIGKALLQARVGDVVTLKTPKGEVDLEITKIEYT
jgi:transcription elongation factor GreB